jgi:hypothetical protein
VTDAAPASRERCSPAHQPDFMFRTETFHEAAICSARRGFRRST